MRALVPYGLVLVAAALAGCVGAPPDGTFACDGGAVTLHCGVNIQYCEQTLTGATVTSAVCRAMPAGCADNPCASCLSASHIPRRLSCSYLQRNDSLESIVQVVP